MNFYNDPEKSVYKKFMKNAKKKNNPEKILKNPAEILKDPFTAKPKKILSNQLMKQKVRKIPNKS